MPTALVLLLFLSRTAQRGNVTELNMQQDAHAHTSTLTDARGTACTRPKPSLNLGRTIFSHSEKAANPHRTPCMLTFSVPLSRLGYLHGIQLNIYNERSTALYGVNSSISISYTNQNRQKTSQSDRRRPADVHSEHNLYNHTRHHRKLTTCNNLDHPFGTTPEYPLAHETPEPRPWSQPFPLSFLAAAMTANCAARCPPLRARLQCSSPADATRHIAVPSSNTIMAEGAIFIHRERPATCRAEPCHSAGARAR